MSEKIVITGGSGFIGTNFIERFKNYYEIYNLDVRCPKIKSHNRFWIEADLLNEQRLLLLLKRIKPTIVIHLAARTDLDGKNLSDYNSNTIATQNLINSLNKAGTIKRVIFTSSKFIVPNGHKQQHLRDYNPHTPYGTSKVVLEQLVFSANLSMTWCIIRPTSIWGEWFGEPYLQFFKRVQSGRYFNIKYNTASKTFGYVGNTIYQIQRILQAPKEVINREIFYLGDYQDLVVNYWAQKIALQTDTQIQEIPLGLIKSAGFLGDFLKIFNIKFPMNTFRLENMTTSCVNELGPIKNIAPKLPYDLEKGISNTLKWIND